MTEHTLSDLAQAIGLPVVGDGSIKVSGVAEPASAGPSDLAVAMKASYADDLREGHAKVAMLWQEADWQALGLQGAILAERPRVALARVTQQFQPAFDANAGIHPSAQIDPSADIGANAVIGAFVQIGPRAQIAQGARIASHVSIGADVRIGPDALLHAGTHIGARCLIGARLVAQAGAVVGADGFSFEPPQQGSVEAVRQTGAVTARNESGFLRIHSLAAVEIGDDVEIGANSTIDRGTLAPTRIGHGTKIDNQVQIAHNVQIGHTCLICAQVGIAGSTEIGDRVVLAGKVGIGDHIKVGSDVVCAGGTLVAGNIPSNSVMMGIPATDRKTAAAQIVALRRLPKLIDQVAQIRKKLGL